MKDIESNIGEYLPKYDIYIQYLPLPQRVFGTSTTVRCDPVAFVNSEQTESRKIIACAHEIVHIQRGDLFKDSHITELEK